MSRAERIEVYLDGQCPLCKWSRARVEPFDRDRRIEWLDFNDPDIRRRAAPHTFTEMAKEMHVRRSDGTWSKGFWGWLDMLKVLPRLSWLSRVLAVWPFARLGPVVYRIVANRRYSMFGVPPPCNPDGLCQLHQTKH